MSMTTFWHRYQFQIIGATLGILFHLLTIGLMFTAEGIVFLILAFVDFPITLLWVIFNGHVEAGGDSIFWTYYIGGTVMYAVLGWFMGPFLERQALLYGFTSSRPKDR